MAGGPSTTDLVIAAGRAEALGFLAAGYKTPGAVAAEITAVRAATAGPFGVNVFVPGRPSAAGRRRGQWRHRADVAVGGTGLSPGGRAARWRDHRLAARMIVVGRMAGRAYPAAACG